ncbi:MAG: hypothetical protein H6751_14075 [Candidatus Omnitrophica bacterium]|nr:hypothetical protein [Candidatus Omnitrophota bacterium]
MVLLSRWKSILSLWILPSFIFFGLGPPVWSQILIDHACTDLSKVPPSYIQTAKTQFRIWFAHTSHGSQITTGMEMLAGDPFTYSLNGSGNTLAYDDTLWADLGYEGDLTWVDTTRTQLNSPGNDRNMVMWSWCGGVYDNTEPGINAYLNAMNQLETDFPTVTFVYMTGHLPTPEEDDWSNLRARNNQIRSYCAANGKILFDFADIESYDPDGAYFFDQHAHDDCSYDGGNWADQWCAAHPGQCPSCTECAHSHCLNCLQKGRAFWWMMARLAGWDGGSGTTTPTATSTATPTSGGPTHTPTTTLTPTAEGATTTPTPTSLPGSEVTLSAILDACESLAPGDIPEDLFTPPVAAVYVATAADGGSDSNLGTSIDQPFEHLHAAINYANDHPETPLTIYLRGGVHYHESSEDRYLSINRGNLYVTNYQNEPVTLRPYYWPNNPSDDWGDQIAFEFYGDSQNITFDGLTLEGWQTLFFFGSELATPPLRNITLKNLVTRNFKRRGGSSEWATAFLETNYLTEGAIPTFANPATEHYQIENLILSHITIEGVDLGINVGDEVYANVKGMRIDHVNIINPPAGARRQRRGRHRLGELLWRAHGSLPDCEHRRRRHRLQILEGGGGQHLCRGNGTKRGQVLEWRRVD